MSSHMNNFSMAATQGSNPSSVSSSSSSAAACNSKRTHHHHHHHGSDSHIQFIEQNLQQIEQERNKVLEECGALKAQVQWMKGRQEALERQLADSSQKIGLERAQSLDLQSNCKKLSSEVQHLKEKLSRNQMLTEKLLKEKSELYKQMTTEYVPVQSHDMSKKEVCFGRFFFPPSSLLLSSFFLCNFSTSLILIHTVRRENRTTNENHRETLVRKKRVAISTVEQLRRKIEIR